MKKVLRLVLYAILFFGFGKGHTLSLVNWLWVHDYFFSAYWLVAAINGSAPQETRGRVNLEPKIGVKGSLFQHNYTFVCSVNTIYFTLLSYFYV